MRPSSRRQHRRTRAHMQAPPTHLHTHPHTLSSPCRCGRCRAARRWRLPRSRAGGSCPSAGCAARGRGAASSPGCPLAWRGAAWHGTAQHGMARHGTARHGRVGRGSQTRGSTASDNGRVVEPRSRSRSSVTNPERREERWSHRRRQGAEMTSGGSPAGGCHQKCSGTKSAVAPKVQHHQKCSGTKSAVGNRCMRVCVRVQKRPRTSEPRKATE